MVWGILLAIIPVFLTVFLAALMRVTGVVNESSEKSLMQLVLLLLYPSFILSTIPGNENLQSAANVGWSLGFGGALTLLGFGVA